MNLHEAIIRIFLAILLGGCVGLEREYTQKSAGLRTHILVTMGATIFMLVSTSDLYSNVAALPFMTSVADRVPINVSLDPSRIAAQIVSGIGFIGGGAVLRYGTTVKGLTTAASLWTMASIGMLVGIGQYRLSIIATILIFLVLFTIGKVERHFFTKNIRTFNRLRVHIFTRSHDASQAQTWMEEHFHNRIVEAKVRSDAQTEKVEMTYNLIAEPGKMTVNEISRQLCRIEGITSATVKTYYENMDAS